MKEQEPWSEAEKRFRLRAALVAMARDGLAIQARRQAAEEAASAEAQENVGEAAARSAIESNPCIGSSDAAVPTSQTDDKTHVVDVR